MTTLRTVSGTNFVYGFSFLKNFETIREVFTFII